MTARFKIFDLGAKLRQLAADEKAEAKKGSSVNYISHTAKANGLMEAANLVMDLALEVQKEEIDGE